MGIDFNGLFRNLANTSKRISQGENLSNERIDTKEELFTFMTGLDGIKNKAKAEKSDMSEADIEAMAKAELSEVLDIQIGRDAGLDNNTTMNVFTEEEISLENLMSYLDENIDMEKVEKYNEKGVISGYEEMQAVVKLGEAGFEGEMLEILIDDESLAGAVRYIVRDIASGSADRISKNADNITSDTETSEQADMAGLLERDAWYQKELV